MRKQIRTMQIVDKDNSIIIPHFIETNDPLHKIGKKLKKILKTARVDTETGFKIIVTSEDKRWDELTFNCIFVDERKHGNVYHFGCFAAYHPTRYIIRKTYKTFKGAMRYFPKSYLTSP